MYSNYWKGKFHSDETKQKIKDAKVGKPGHPAYNKGQPRSEIDKNKIKLTMKDRNIGQLNPMFGKHHREETKQLLRLVGKLIPHTHHIDFDHSNNEENNLIELSNSKHQIAACSIHKLVKTLLNNNIIRFNRDLAIYELVN